MRERIIRESIHSLQQEGLRFSIDSLAQTLRISKKTVYKYFPDKETLALAIYETYYDELHRQLAEILSDGAPTRNVALLRLYYDAKQMTREDIFNKYKLNPTIRAYVASRNDALWDALRAALGVMAGSGGESLRVIIDGTFEKLCHSPVFADAVMERLVHLL